MSWEAVIPPLTNQVCSFKPIRFFLIFFLLPYICTTDFSDFRNDSTMNLLNKIKDLQYIWFTTENPSCTECLQYLQWTSLHRIMFITFRTTCMYD